MTTPSLLYYKNDRKRDIRRGGGIKISEILHYVTFERPLTRVNCIKISLNITIISNTNNGKYIYRREFNLKLVLVCVDPVRICGFLWRSHKMWLHTINRKTPQAISGL